MDDKIIKCDNCKVEFVVSKDHSEEDICDGCRKRLYAQMYPYCHECRRNGFEFNHIKICLKKLLEKMGNELDGQDYEELRINVREIFGNEFLESIIEDKEKAKFLLNGREND